MTNSSNTWLSEEATNELLCAAHRDDGRIREILQKARELKGLNQAEVAALCQITAPEQVAELFADKRSYTIEVAVLAECLAVMKAKGYRVVLVVPDKMSTEKVLHLKAMGAEVHITR